MEKCSKSFKAKRSFAIILGERQAESLFSVVCAEHSVSRGHGCRLARCDADAKLSYMR